MQAFYDRIQALEGEVKSLKSELEQIQADRLQEAAVLSERLDELETLHQRTGKIAKTITSNRRVLALCLLWIASILAIGLMLAVDLADGKIDNAKQEMDVIGSAAGAIGSLSVLVAAGGADKQLKR